MTDTKSYFNKNHLRLDLLQSDLYAPYLDILPGVISTLKENTIQSIHVKDLDKLWQSYMELLAVLPFKNVAIPDSRQWRNIYESMAEVGVYILNGYQKVCSNEEAHAKIDVRIPQILNLESKEFRHLFCAHVICNNPLINLAFLPYSFHKEVKQEHLETFLFSRMNHLDSATFADQVSHICKYWFSEYGYMRHYKRGPSQDYSYPQEFVDFLKSAFEHASKNKNKEVDNFDVFITISYLWFNNLRTRLKSDPSRSITLLLSPNNSEFEEFQDIIRPFLRKDIIDLSSLVDFNTHTDVWNLYQQLKIPMNGIEHTSLPEFN